MRITTAVFAIVAAVLALGVGRGFVGLPIAAVLITGGVLLLLNKFAGAVLIIVGSSIMLAAIVVIAVVNLINDGSLWLLWLFGFSLIPGTLLALSIAVVVKMRRATQPPMGYHSSW